MRYIRQVNYEGRGFISACGSGDMQSTIGQPCWFSSWPWCFFSQSWGNTEPSMTKGSAPPVCVSPQKAPSSQSWRLYSNNLIQPNHLPKASPSDTNTGSVFLVMILVPLINALGAKPLTYVPRWAFRRQINIQSIAYKISVICTKYMLFDKSFDFSH